MGDLILIPEYNTCYYNLSSTNVLLPFNTVSLCVQELLPSIKGTHPIPHRDANTPSPISRPGSRIPPWSLNLSSRYFRASNTLLRFNKPRKNL